MAYREWRSADDERNYLLKEAISILNKRTNGIECHLIQVINLLDKICNNFSKLHDEVEKTIKINNTNSMVLENRINKLTEQVLSMSKALHTVTLAVGNKGL